MKSVLKFARKLFFFVFQLRVLIQMNFTPTNCRGVSPMSRLQFDHLHVDDGVCECFVVQFDGPCEVDLCIMAVFGGARFLYLVVRSFAASQVVNFHSDSLFASEHCVGIGHCLQLITAWAREHHS